MWVVYFMVALATFVWCEVPANLSKLIAAHPRRPQLAQGQEPGQEVSFSSGGLTLKGYIYKPKGSGPFPALLWNHGSEKMPGAQPELAAFYNARGFVFFIPHRHGHGLSAGPYIVDLEKSYEQHHRNDTRAVWRDQVRLLDQYNVDVHAAVEWLRAQPYVDGDRIIMSGCSYGGIQTLLSAEKGWGVRAFIPFAPAAMSWANTYLRQRLLRAVHNAKGPLFLVQAENDYSTGPMQLLGAAIRAKGGVNQAKLYSIFGTTHQQGHGAFACWDIGTRVWGADLMSFIHSVLR